MLKHSKKVENFAGGILQIANVDKHTVLSLQNEKIHFTDKKLRFGQYHNARLNGVDVDRVICCPLGANIKIKDVLFLEGEFYKIKFIEHKETMPPSKWIYLASSNFSWSEQNG